MRWYDDSTAATLLSTDAKEGRGSSDALLTSSSSDFEAAFRFVCSDVTLSRKRSMLLAVVSGRSPPVLEHAAVTDNSAARTSERERIVANMTCLLSSREIRARG